MTRFQQRGSYALIALFLTALAVTPVPAAAGPAQAGDVDDPNVVVDPSFLEALSYRATGFSRGGRATAVTGIPSEPLMFFAGYTGGGVWKTTDAGVSWRNISDGFFGVGSIGDIKVADSDPNVIFVGTGSGCPRGNVSTGDGIYKSTDMGKTWVHVGLRDGGQIPEIAIHPSDPRSCLRSRASATSSTPTRSAASSARWTVERAGERSSTSARTPGSTTSR